MDIPSANASSRRFWRTFEERLDTEAFRDYMAREFPDQAAEWTDPVTRRQFLTLMGASLALAGVSGCSSQQAPPEKIVPYVRQPEGLVLGKPLFFATAMPLSGAATGLLVQSNEGRPTKIEGNPLHPVSQGATDVYAQASILGLYDPDRSRTVRFRGRIRSWSDAVSELRGQFEKFKKQQGAGLRILTEAIASPTLARQLEDLKKALPQARCIAYEPAALGAGRDGVRAVYGKALVPLFDYTKADVVLALDDDFLSCGPAHLKHVRDFIGRRRQGREGTDMNRLYVVESTTTNTGLFADHRLPLRPSQIEAFARRLAQALEVGEAPAAEPLPAPADRWLTAVAADLRRAAGKCVVTAGDGQPSGVHALVHAINAKLGNVAKTVAYLEPAATGAEEGLAALRQLVEEMDAGKVELLLIVGGNPVFTAPADLRFKDRLEKVPLRFYLGLSEDETSQQCHWHIPEAHFLETWSDARAVDGTATILQPLIAPLYGGRSAHELISAFAEEAMRPSYAIVRGYWQDPMNRPSAAKAVDFETWWRRAVHDGVVPGTAYGRQEVSVQAGWTTHAGLDRPASAPGGDTLEIVFRLDPNIHDGRFANNGWLQELPRQVTKITWDNAALMSPATAEKLGVGFKEGDRGGSHGQAITDVLELEYAGQKLRMPAWVVPGHADGAVTVHLGFGRTHAGEVGTAVGVNTYALWTSDAPFFGTGLRVRKTQETFILACTMAHQPMDLSRVAKERGIFLASTIDEFRNDPSFLKKAEAEHKKNERIPLTMYPDHQYPESRWGMSIDLGSCVGCGACVIACQAENNIPVVGKTEVTQGREMHWLRIDRYFEGEEANPQAVFQPVPCMHCENAPCELVCPVEATVHGNDGLNEMIYNRCVGTRYCSNNCPYKVRRFNFLQYADYATESLKLMRNPDVTVRSRGVMEKCTYCVQRIREAEINAKNQHRGIRDGDVVTACMAACPAEAIIFGNVNDKTSRVSRLKGSPLDFGMLADLNTRPQTTYLAALRNPNPDPALTTGK